MTNRWELYKIFLKKELVSSIFATQHKISPMVNLEYVEPVTGMFKFGSELIFMSFKLIKKCLVLWMDMRQKKENQNNNKAYKKIYICINLDHRTGHSRILDSPILRYQYDRRSGAWWKDVYSCSLQNSLFKKDNAKIIYNDLGNMIDYEVLQIQNISGILIFAHDKYPVL